MKAIATKLGVPHPSLADVAAAAGCPITLAATSLARRAPVYLSSSTHPDMPVRDALRGKGEGGAAGIGGERHCMTGELHCCMMWVTCTGRAQVVLGCTRSPAVCKCFTQCCLQCSTQQSMLKTQPCQLYSTVHSLCSQLCHPLLFHSPESSWQQQQQQYCCQWRCV